MIPSRCRAYEAQTAQKTARRGLLPVSRTRLCRGASRAIIQATMPRIVLVNGSLLMLFIAGPLTAQFSQLTMTDDGQQIYFISPLLLKSNPGRGGISEGRLYRVGTN